MSKKIKVLAWLDYCCNTGFATVSRNIIKNLDDTGDFDIDVVGINYDGDPYDKEKWAGNVYPAMRGRMMTTAQYADVFGRQRVLDLLGSKQYDVLFMIQDTFVAQEFMPNLVEGREFTGTKMVYYYPIDSVPDPSWITEVVSKVDYPITYTNYAYDQTVKVDPKLKGKLDIIYHGTNTKEFFPMGKGRAEFRKSYFSGMADDKFIIMNLNRNQPRKDILRTLLIQKELKERGAKTFLYLHMSGKDVGGDIQQWGEQLGLELGKDYIFPENLGDGYPLHIINQLYNAVDCVITTTHGEGWGLSLTEAMATKCPIIAPDITSISEILAENRGILVPAGTSNHDWYTQGLHDNNRLRPLMDVIEAADAIQDLIMGDNSPDVEGAYDWAVAQDWTIISKQFEKIIRKAANGRPIIGQTPDGSLVKVNRQQRRKMARAK